MVEGRCPSCGAPVTFSVGSARVVVCEYCHTVVAREGAHLVSHGQLAALAETDSPLKLGLEGRVGSRPFRLVGHLQRDHGAGPWDEWYVAFDDGGTGWLSESEGAFHLMEPSGVLEGVSFADFHPGERVLIQGRRAVVEEARSAHTVAAAGQLPSDVSEEGTTRYVDATGAGGLFYTLDFGTGDADPDVYAGRRVQLKELNIPPDMLQPRRRKPVRLEQARCPQCNGALELRAPDHTKRVACPFCGALLDASQGKLAFLQALEPPRRPLRLPLGAKGRLEGVERLVIGWQLRSCRVEGTRYEWEEYLLYHPEAGFTFLMESNGHWTHLVPVPAGEVAFAQDTVAHYQGHRYAAFQAVTATTDQVRGEFYWEVRAGERTHATEYVDPPHSLNEDRTDEEVTFTHGTWLEPTEVERAFGLKNPLPAPRGIAPNQPNPRKARAKSSLKWALVYGALGLLLYLGASALAARKVVLEESFVVPPGAAAGSPEAMKFIGPFEIPTRGNVRVEVSSSMQNGWLGVQGDLLNAETNEGVSFYEELSYYSGFEGGEHWSEGNRSVTDHLSRVPAGRYTLRLVPFFEAGRTSGLGAREPLSYSVRLTSDVPRFMWLLWLWGALGLGVVLAHAHASSFEKERWAESTFGVGED